MKMLDTFVSFFSKLFDNMPRDRADVEQALLKKGLVYKGVDHRFYFLEHKGLTTAIFTKVSHGSKYKTLDDSLLSRMAKQAKLTNKQFENFVDCPMSQDDYIVHLQTLGIIRRS